MNWTRNKTVQLILDFENKYKNETWIIDDIDIWPFIRVKLFFFIIRSKERNSFLKTERLVNYNKPRKLDRIFLYFKQLFRYRSISKNDIMFVGAESHRSMFNDLSYNKFFDPIRYNIEFKKCPLFEYSYPTVNTYNVDNTYSFSILNAFFLLGNKSINDNQHNIVWERLNNMLKQFIVDDDIKVENINDFVGALKKGWLKIELYKRSWIKIINKVEPKRIFTLCYYTDAVYALNLAASDLGVETFEMQHGPINSMHLAYGSYNKLKVSSKSSLLPTRFLVWDEISMKNLLTSFPDKKVDILGLPWFDFIATNYQKVLTDRRIILYALQPISETGELFPDYLINWINQSSKDYLWYFRLHPRQMHEYNVIVAKLSKLFPNVEYDIDLATNTPLPVLLNHCEIVISKVSGVLIEASLLNIKSIALDEIAHDYYKEQYESRSIYICAESDKNSSISDLYIVIQDFFKKNNVVQEKDNSLKNFNRIMGSADSLKKK